MFSQYTRLNTIELCDFINYFIIETPMFPAVRKCVPRMYYNDRSVYYRKRLNECIQSDRKCRELYKTS